MSDRALILVLLVVTSGLAALLLAGHGPWSGAVLVSIDPRHGLNSGDVPVLIGWVVGVAACAALWLRR